MMRVCCGVSALLAVVLTAACGGSNTPPQGGETAPGADRTAKTAALETGADLMQAKAPVEKTAMYLNGFHVSKDDPKMSRILACTSWRTRSSRRAANRFQTASAPARHRRALPRGDGCRL